MVHKLSRPGKTLHSFYLIAIWIKGIDGVLETLGGVLLLVASRVTLNRLVACLTQHEIVEDPTDWLVLHLRYATSHLSAHSKTFYAFYLLGHGCIKMFLVWGGLLRRKLWAFPTALAFLGAFIGYQSYRLVHRWSVTLLLLTGIDLVVWLLIWREYRVQTAAGLPADSSSSAEGLG